MMIHTTIMCISISIFHILFPGMSVISSVSPAIPATDFFHSALCNSQHFLLFLNLRAIHFYPVHLRFYNRISGSGPFLTTPGGRGVQPPPAKKGAGWKKAPGWDPPPLPLPSRPLIKSPRQREFGGGRGGLGAGKKGCWLASSPWLGWTPPPGGWGVRLKKSPDLDTTGYNHILRKNHSFRCPRTRFRFILSEAIGGFSQTCAHDGMKKQRNFNMSLWISPRNEQKALVRGGG